MYHAHCQWLRGGYLGVEIFFVISGFLITGLLLKEYARTGRIDLAGFWARRSRRLVPALLLFIFCLGTFGVAFLGLQAAQIRGDLLPSLLYGENWYQIGSGSSYFADRGLPLLRHLWSLSVEGQFYLVWPFLVVAFLGFFKGGLRPLAALTALLAAGSVAMMIHIADPWNVSSVAAAASLNRAYLGTDTRAFGLLGGALLAMLTLRPGRGGRWVDRALNLGSLAALAGLGALLARTELQTAFLFHGGFLLVDACTILVLAALIRPTPSWLGRALGWGPLEWLGQRSYGLYLWHWPVFLLLAAGRDGWAWWLLRLALALALTELSYRWVEVPARSQGAVKALFTRPFQAACPQPWGAFALAGLATVAGIAAWGAVRLNRLPLFVDPVEASIQAGAAALDNRSAEAEHAPSPVQATARGAEGSRQAGSAPGAEGASSGAVLPPMPLPEGLEGLRVTAIGDSVMKGAAPNLKKAGETCLGAGRIVINAEESRSFFPALQIIRTYKLEDRLGEVVVIHLGTNNSSIPTSQLWKLMELLADRRLVLFLTVKSDKAEACATVNKELASRLAGYPNARIFDWRTAADPHPEFFYTDQTHLRPLGAQYYSAMILAQIARYARVVASPPPPAG
jgi:peptidoglycan/LPS O-acetylase OafA/YrhL